MHHAPIFQSYITGSGGGGFNPITNTYNSGSGTETVPSGATGLTVKMWNKGGNGALRSGLGNSYGGGGGPYAVKTFAVVAGDISKSLAWNLSTSTVTVVGDAAATNLTNAALNFSLTPGANGTTSAGGAGGTASGGSTNLSGSAGYLFHGGAAAGPGGGAGGDRGDDGFAPGGGGGGEDDGTNGNLAGAGGGPRLIFEWT